MINKSFILGKINKLPSCSLAAADWRSSRLLSVDSKALCTERTCSACSAAAYNKIKDKIINMIN